MSEYTPGTCFICKNPIPPNPAAVGRSHCDSCLIRIFSGGPVLPPKKEEKS